MCGPSSWVFLDKRITYCHDVDECSRILKDPGTQNTMHVLKALHLDAYWRTWQC